MLTWTEEMDKREESEEREVHIQGVWCPATPFEPVEPRSMPIYRTEANQLPENWCRSDKFSFCSTTEAHVIEKAVACSDTAASDCVGTSSVWGSDFEGTCFYPSVNVADRFEGIPFLELLALADAGSASSVDAAASFGHEMGPKCSLMSFSDGRFENNVDCMTESPENIIFYPHQHAYDLNFPPETKSDSASVAANPKFAPITPDKAKRLLSLIQSTPSVDRRDEEQQNKKFSTPERPISADVCTPNQENQNLDKELAPINDQIDTPQPKPRRRKHRPKVITEGKSRKTPKPVTPQPEGSKEDPRVKRAYVRKKLKNPPVTPPTEVGAELANKEAIYLSAKSCRRVLNFDAEVQPRDEGSSRRSFSLDSELKTQDFHTEKVQSCSNTHFDKEIGQRVQDIQVDTSSYDLHCFNSQMPEGYRSLSAEVPTEQSSPESKQQSNSQECFHIEQDNRKQFVPTNDTRPPSSSPDHSILSTTPTSNEKGQKRGSKRGRSYTDKQAKSSSTNLTGVHYNSLQAYQMCYPVHVPTIHKKRRTEKGQASTPFRASTVTAVKNMARQRSAGPQNEQKQIINPTAAIDWLYGPQFCTTDVREEGKGFQDKLHTFECIMNISQTEILKKKRSRGRPQQVHDMASLAQQPLVGSELQRFGGAHRPHTSRAALAVKVRAKTARKKRTKTFVDISTTSGANGGQQGLISYNHHQSFVNPLGTSTQVIGRRMFSLDTIVEQLKHLDLNRENSEFAYQFPNALVQFEMQNQDQNALVIYRRDGTIIPFEGSFKKRRPRPKVDLDDETTRVWRLLLGNINSEGIDGTDEHSAQWWEEERRVFRGRADSFIARMHLVQGDRRFSPWKGSVLDSVVGVFLTQNVSDHLSSSAFMSLAAQFPLNSRSNHEACYEEGASEVVDEPDDGRKGTEQNLEDPIYKENSVTISDIEQGEEKEIIISNESSGSNAEDALESKETELKLANSSESVLEFYSSGVENSSATEMIETVQPFCSDERATNDTVSTHVSFSLSQDLMDSSSISQAQENIGQMQSDALSIKARNQESGTEHDIQKGNEGQADGIENFFKDSMNDFVNTRLQLNMTSRVMKDEGLERYREEPNYFDGSKSKDDYDISEQSTITVESTSQAPILNNLVADVCEEPVGNSGKRDDKMHQNMPTISGGILHVMEKTTESKSRENEHSISKEISNRKAALKSKIQRVGKEIKEDVNWDNLRKQAEVKGVKRERTVNTMDSLDWEAVRCADVNEIAYTIKERGMNNILAERIKNFLNRLVKDHGSLNLEWLRDVEPDKAKEYLLSFRGLGLKSVECVRLLTLHHLAFPVDTNVGRIAVRLGWVPLQPLPESLQLHLLELYPVLESIQKYLWPRLCKLDQRTLYELHYQMITFGKVFCTKSKPNCNACPMRGECRHFASAFASARLSLPAPEEQSIAGVNESRKSDENPALIINQQPLPLLHAANQSEDNQLSKLRHECDGNHGVSNSQPIIEEPATPEPEHTQVQEVDIEDAFFEDPDEIPTIKLNIDEFTQNLQNFMQNNLKLQDGDMSKALVALHPEAASLPTPKLKNVGRLRTEHQVYELPDSHPLLEKLKLERRERDDPCFYLLAIWTPGETANSIQPPDRRCSHQENGTLCEEKECPSCSSIREANAQMVRGTLLIPCRTAMRGSFPLNGTYFQVNEVFSDHDSSLNPIDVPRAWLWNLQRRTVYFGTSIPTIFKGLSTEGIQHCFWRGYVCVRGFDQKSRAPRPLMARLHFPASKLNRTKDRTDDQ